MISADILGSLLQHNLVPVGGQIESCLRFVLESLQHPPAHRMREFGLRALEKFRGKLDAAHPLLVNMITSSINEDPLKSGKFVPQASTTPTTNPSSSSSGGGRSSGSSDVGSVGSG